uniref:DH domain-containing protein n=1 Tax=Syphacia muris TaxID=451379 RepID=A0A0N5AW91_9BILA
MDSAIDSDNEKLLVQSENELLREILDTEDAYVDSLRIIAEEYMPLFDTTDPERTKVMKKFKSLIFGAIEDVYIYHTNIIYPDLIAINKKDEIPSVKKFAEVIANRKDAFDPYAFYVQGRPASKMLLAYNLGQHKSLKLIDAALSSKNKAAF